MSTAAKDSRYRNMALSSKELMSLLTILAEDGLATNNLESIAASFHRCFTKQDGFRVLNALIMLLEMKDLLPGLPQRIAALFLLYEVYRSDGLSANPFTLFFAEVVQPSVVDDRVQQGLSCGYSLEQTEIWFLSQLLSTSVPRDLFKKTPVAIAMLDSSSLPPVDIPNLVSVLSAEEPVNRVGQSCLLADPDPILPRHVTGLSEAGRVIETIMCGADQITENTFEPAFMRPLPPLYICDNEVTWLNPTESQYPIQWDTQMCLNGSAEVKGLFEKACKDSLAPSEQQQLSQCFEADPRLVQTVGLTPQKLPQLVEKNPTTAIEVILKLIHSTQIEEYLAALLNMEMSLHSMEVVNRLTTAVDLPHEFLHLYINHCIQRCRESNDKSLQSRLVRLVCVFLQSLIRNKVINVQDEFVEIQSFCLDYSRIKEAAALYRLLKTLDNEQTGANK